MKIVKLFKDIKESADIKDFIFFLSINNIKLRFKQTTFGPLWSTIGSGFFILCLTFVMGNISQSENILIVPHLSVGVIVWFFFLNYIVESTTIFGSRKNFLLNFKVPKTAFIFQILFQNLFIFFFNFIIYLIVVFIYPSIFSFKIFLLFFTLPLFILNIFSMSIIVSIIAIRFNDFAQTIRIILQLTFFITPIFWLPEVSIKNFYIKYNLVYHLIELIRAPLIGNELKYFSIVFTIVSALVFTIIAIIVFEKYQNRINHWIR